MYAAPVQELIDELGRLPGIGPKSAQRIAFHILKLAREDAVRLSRAIADRAEELTLIEARDCGKPVKQARADVAACARYFEFYGGAADKLHGATIPYPREFSVLTWREPHGVTGHIIPWNYPLQIFGRSIGAALAAGNACVIKPAEDTPLSTFNLVQALTDAGLPKGVVNIVTGFGPETGGPLVEHPDIRAVSFTGSSEVGRIVGEAAARSFKPCSLEMGGKNAIIILDDANLDLALEGVLWGAFGTTGQRCTATSRVIVQKGIYQEFATKLARRAQHLKVGNGLDESMEMGPQINRQQIETTEQYVEVGKTQGAKLALGGKRPAGPTHQHGWFFEPTIFSDVDSKMRIAQEEIFGPVVSLIPCDTFDDAIDIANGVPYGLSSSIYTRDVNRAFRAMRDIYAGITYVNAPTIGAEVHLPFGGTKATGNGHREGGLGAIDFYTQWKSIYVDYSDRLQRAQIDNAE